jgi:hypothetical protein
MGKKMSYLLGRKDGFLEMQKQNHHQGYDITYQKIIIIIVSFIGFILLTKLLSCKVVVIAGMPYNFKVFGYLEFISLI